jgi:signal transduction histidine kinase/HPt (histidine-containing phosphotransfer) domain-containing protein/FixJ family two-component response regulator
MSEQSGKIHSLSYKLLIIFVPLVCVAVVGLFAVLEYGQYRSQRADLIEALDELVNVQSSAFIPAVWELDTEQVAKLLHEVGRLPQIQGGVVLDSVGGVLASTGDWESAPSSPEFRAERLLIHKTANDQETVGKLIVTVHSAQIYQELIDRLKVNGLVLAVLVWALVASTLIATRTVLSRPLKRLRASIDKITREGIRETVQWDSQDELGQLVRAFNELQAQQSAQAVEEEKRLKFQTEIMEITLEHMDQGISMIDSNQVFTAFNRKFAELFQLPGSFKVGATMKDFIRHNAKAGMYGNVDIEETVERLTSSDRQFKTRQLERTRSDGTVIEIRINSVENWGQVSTYTDITSRRKFEQDLARQAAVIEETENLLRDAIENISEGFVIYDANDRMVICNEQYKKLFPTISDLMEPGVTFEELVDFGLQRDQYGGETGARDNDEVKRERMENHNNPTGEGIIQQMASGHWMVVRERRTSSGGIVGIRSDVTDLKDAENELRVARDAAESAGEAKAAFLATMSHEIRTPMNGVIGMIDLLQQTKLTTDQSEMVNTVRTSAYALLTIINDILDFSKIEAGKLDLESIPISIVDTLENVAETMSVNARNKNIWLRVYVDPKIPEAVLGDQVRLRQILFNLGGNAVKFTEKGGVLIRADLLESSTEDEAKIRIQIIDSGIGLTEKGKAGLFQAFTQAESSTTRRFGGTGLGLTICQRLVEMMESEIEVESVYGEGSTFSVTLTLPIAHGHSLGHEDFDLNGLNVVCMVNNELILKYLKFYGASVSSLNSVDEIPALVSKLASESDATNIVYIGTQLIADDRFSVIKKIQSISETANTRFVIGTRDRDINARDELENTVYVETSPLKRTSFIRSIAIAAGRASPDVNYNRSDILDVVKVAPSIEEAEAAGQLILLAEDNLTNQKVILRQLHNLGYAAEITNDGKEALEALEKKPYAILLTDCHMPNLDGFGLTEAVRQREVGTGKRLPIVAITASALKAEVDHCFEVGMDDFLSKPVEIPKLQAALKKWLPDAILSSDRKDLVTVSEEAPPIDNKDDQGVLDLTALTDVFGDDLETVKEILNEFIEPSNDCCREIEEAFASQSASGVAAAAHKLKSSSRSVGANELADMCTELEFAGKNDDWGKINEIMPHLPGVMRQVSQYIENM